LSCIICILGRCFGFFLVADSVAALLVGASAVATLRAYYEYVLGPTVNHFNGNCYMGPSVR